MVDVTTSGNSSLPSRLGPRRLTLMTLAVGLSRKTPSWTQPTRAYRITVCRVAGDHAGRVDSWIWSVRLTRTRSAASGACRAGHVRVNGIRVKPAHAVRAGDEVRLLYEGREYVVVVQRVITKRVGAPVAAECYIDNSPPPPPRCEWRLSWWLPATAARAVRPNVSAGVSTSCSGGRLAERFPGVNRGWNPATEKARPPRPRDEADVERVNWPRRSRRRSSLRHCCRS